MKIILVQGLDLNKGGEGSGDIDGHEFHGNQWSHGAILRYTGKGKGYLSINNDLRYVAENKWDKNTSKDVKTIDNLMKKNKTKEETTLFRIIDKYHAEELLASGEFQDKAYVSTSSNMDWALSRINKNDVTFMLQLEVPAGIGALDLSDNPVPKFGSEDEILLERNLHFEVIETGHRYAKLKVSK
jgi:hypothetical protein